MNLLYGPLCKIYPMSLLNFRTREQARCLCVYIYHYHGISLDKNEDFDIFHSTGMFGCLFSYHIVMGIEEGSNFFCGSDWYGYWWFFFVFFHIKGFAYFWKLTFLCFFKFTQSVWCDNLLSLLPDAIILSGPKQITIIKGKN